MSIFTAKCKKHQYLRVHWQKKSTASLKNSTDVPTSTRFSNYAFCDQVKLQLGGDQQEISVQRAIVGDRERQIQELKERLKEAESKLYDEQMAKEDAEDETIEMERKLKNSPHAKKI